MGRGGARRCDSGEGGGHDYGDRQQGGEKVPEPAAKSPQRRYPSRCHYHQDNRKSKAKCDDPAQASAPELEQLVLRLDISELAVVSGLSRGTNIYRSQGHVLDSSQDDQSDDPEEIEA
jgi:hypothetical protein